MEVQDEMGSQEAQGPTVHQGHLVQQEIVGKMENRDHLVIQVHKEKEVSARNIARLMVVYSLKMVLDDKSCIDVHVQPKISWFYFFMYIVIIILWVRK